MWKPHKFLNKNLIYATPLQVGHSQDFSGAGDSPRSSKVQIEYYQKF